MKLPWMSDRLSGKELQRWIVDRLKILREGTGCTAEEFAGRVGIALAYLYKIERHESEPSVRVIDEWLTVCGKDLGGFFKEISATESRSPGWTKWHDYLDQILGSGDDFKIDEIPVVEGIKLNLLAIAGEVNRAKKDNARSEAASKKKRKRAVLIEADSSPTTSRKRQGA